MIPRMVRCIYLRLAHRDMEFWNGEYWCMIGHWSIGTMLSGAGEGNHAVFIASELACQFDEVSGQPFFVRQADGCLALY